MCKTTWKPKASWRKSFRQCSCCLNWSGSLDRCALGIILYDNELCMLQDTGVKNA
jgi:hypothetical protein